MHLYKCVRPDGLDFYSATIDYAAELGTGRPVRHPNPDLGAANAGGYLSAATVATDCTGMRWPCRLLRVQPVGRCIPDPDLRNKMRCEALLIVEELPGYYAFGPQGPEVAALIERAGRLTADDVRGLEVARIAGAATAAWAAAWAAARAAARDAAWAATIVWAAAAAARALLVRDVLAPEHYQTLTRPWATVIGPCHPDDPPGGYAMNPCYVPEPGRQPL